MSVEGGSIIVHVKNARSPVSRVNFPTIISPKRTETYCAMRLFIDSWRWAGVPWHLRSDKLLAESGAEVVVQLKAPPQKLFEDSWPPIGDTNYLRFQLSPCLAIAFAACVKRVGEEFIGDQKESCIFLMLSQMSKHLMKDF